MTQGTRLNWGRVVLAVVTAEVVPILALVAVVIAYGLIKSADSPTPEEFAPAAGRWVGPIAGFFVTLACSLWGARRAAHRPLAHGLAIGAGTAMLDFILGVLLGGGGAIEPLFIISNLGRLAAGLLGGSFVARGQSSTSRKSSHPNTPEHRG